MKGRKVKQQESDRNSHINPILKLEVPKGQPSLRLKFEARIDQMGKDILPYQRQTLLNLFDAAIRSEDPYTEFIKGFDSKINQPDGWGKDQAPHLKRNLLPVLEPYY